MLTIKPAHRTTSAMHAPTAAETDVGRGRPLVFMAEVVATIARAAAISNRAAVSKVNSLIQSQSAPRVPKPTPAIPRSAARWFGLRVKAPAAQAIARMATKLETKMKMRPSRYPMPWPSTSRMYPSAVTANSAAKAPGTDTPRSCPKRKVVTVDSAYGTTKFLWSATRRREVACRRRDTVSPP